MRIGIDARMYGAQATTGIGTYIKQLTDALFLIDKTNEYVLFMRPEMLKTFIPPSPRIRIVEADIPWYSWSEQMKLPAIIAREQCDIVHFPHFNVPLFYRGRYVVTIHDLTPKFFPGPNVRRSFVRKFAYEMVFRRGIHRAEKVITISNHTKKQLNTYHLAVMRNVAVIGLGVDGQYTPNISPEKLSAIKEKYRIKKPYIVYVGVWRDHKNIPGLVKAFECIHRDHGIDAQLVLCGTPDDRYPEVIAAIEHSPVRSDIVLPGFVDDADLPGLYAGATANILVSFAEGFGLVALEAAACGTPTVCSNSTSVPEVMGDAVLSCDPKDSADIAEKIALMFTDELMRKTLSARGIERAQSYRWDECARKTLDIYQTV